jgi:hypothetical protein
MSVETTEDLLRGVEGLVETFVCFTRSGPIDAVANLARVLLTAPDLEPCLKHLHERTRDTNFINEMVEFLALVHAPFVLVNERDGLVVSLMGPCASEGNQAGTCHVDRREAKRLLEERDAVVVVLDPHARATLRVLRHHAPTPRPLRTDARRRLARAPSPHTPVKTLAPAPPTALDGTLAAALAAAAASHW